MDGEPNKRIDGLLSNASALKSDLVAVLAIEMNLLFSSHLSHYLSSLRTVVYLLFARGISEGEHPPTGFDWL